MPRVRRRRAQRADRQMMRNQVSALSTSRMRRIWYTFSRAFAVAFVMGADYVRTH
jgi:hypothetical protein